MPDTAIAIQRIAGNAVRVQFDPGGGHGTAVFMIDLAREVGGTVDEADRQKVLPRAMAVAENFIGYVKKQSLLSVRRQRLPVPRQSPRQLPRLCETRYIQRVGAGVRTYAAKHFHPLLRYLAPLAQLRGLFCCLGLADQLPLQSSEGPSGNRSPDMLYLPGFNDG